MFPREIVLVTEILGHILSDLLSRTLEEYHALEPPRRNSWDWRSNAATTGSRRKLVGGRHMLGVVLAVDTTQLINEYKLNSE